MKVIILSDQETPSELRRLSADFYTSSSREGQRLAQLYGVVDWPTVLVVRDDGALVEIWQGSWPTLAQVDYHYSASI